MGSDCSLSCTTFFSRKISGSELYQEDGRSNHQFNSLATKNDLRQKFISSNILIFALCKYGKLGSVNTFAKHCMCAIFFLTNYTHHQIHLFAFIFEKCSHCSA
ncbi:hypothetical protein XENORESO_015036 [Xenotaenia resolanae]|uniref:Uncharacterized protein n=1 Tax=Xenotaenia resolanae TaxID=208358 RepID=A0ABV0XB25_9TELE